MALILGYSNQSQAALLIEPVVGFNVGTKFDLKFDDFPAQNENFSGGKGGAFGGRLGYQNFGFQLGLDYLKSSIDMNSSYFKTNISLSEWAGFVGYEFPLFVRVYAGYIFSANGSTKKAASESVDLSKGTGSKLGVGFTGLPFVDINFEYRTGTINQMSYGGTDYDTEIRYSSLMLGLSVPFTI
jgi:hypothetical protein